jgi:hypothetical protein
MEKIYEFKKELNKKTIVARVEIELTDNGVFTASGSLKVGRICCSGQCIEGIYNYFYDNETMATIYNMWKKHHLNDLHPGTEKQEEALEKAGYTSWANNYRECCDYLESIGLYEDNGYKFGCGWLKREIPQEDLEIIKGLLN